jgi:phage-related protein
VAASLRQRLSSESLSCEFWQRHGNVAAMSWQQPGRQAEIVVRSTQNWPIPPHPCEGL